MKKSIEIKLGWHLSHWIREWRKNWSIYTTWKKAPRKKVQSMPEPDRTPRARHDILDRIEVKIDIGESHYRQRLETLPYVHNNGKIEIYRWNAEPQSEWMIQTTQHPEGRCSDWGPQQPHVWLCKLDHHVWWDALKCKFFLTTMNMKAVRWFDKLSSKSIVSWSYFYLKFIQRFRHSWSKSKKLAGLPI